MKFKFSLLLFFSYLFLLQSSLQAERVLVPGQIAQVQPGQPLPMVMGKIYQINPIEEQEYFSYPYQEDVEFYDNNLNNSEQIIFPGQIVQVQPGEPLPMAFGKIYQLNPNEVREDNFQEDIIVTNNTMPCQCYCSDLCGPRDAKEDDTPFVDPETGECFCKQRDKDNYLPHGCNIKNPNPVIENSCCSIR